MVHTLLSTQFLAVEPLLSSKTTWQIAQLKHKENLKNQCQKLKQLIQIISTHSVLFHSITMLSWDTDMPTTKCSIIWMVKLKWIQMITSIRPSTTHMTMETKDNIPITGSALFQAIMHEILNIEKSTKNCFQYFSEAYLKINKYQKK